MKKTINCSGNLIDLSNPKVMGIINLTPDSFFEPSRANNAKKILSLAEKHVLNGANFLDCGAYSTRPGAKNIEEKEEIERIKSQISQIAKEFPDIPISIDTFRSEVAKVAVNEGASLINDVSGGKLDPKMFKIVADLKVPYILMHMRGTPEDMSYKTNYLNLENDIIEELNESVIELKNLGVTDIIIDPGFGFAKTLDQNYDLLKNLKLFQIFEYPILVGLSRKSMVYKLLEIEPEESLSASSVLNMVALQNGASILRVHDCKEANQVIRMFSLLN